MDTNDNPESAALFLLIKTLLSFPPQDRRRMLELIRRGVDAR